MMGYSLVDEFGHDLGELAPIGGWGDFGRWAPGGPIRDFFVSGETYEPQALLEALESSYVSPNVRDIVSYLIGVLRTRPDWLAVDGGADDVPKPDRQQYKRSAAWLDVLALVRQGEDIGGLDSQVWVYGDWVVKLSRGGEQSAWLQAAIHAALGAISPPTYFVDSDPPALLQRFVPGRDATRQELEELRAKIARRGVIPGDFQDFNVRVDRWGKAWVIDVGGYAVTPRDIGVPQALTGDQAAAILSQRQVYQLTFGDDLDPQNPGAAAVRARAVDLVKLPVAGANCGNCRWFERRGWCNEPRVLLPVSADWCCGLWDAPGTIRPYQE